MSCEKIEEMLYQAQTKLPTTELQWQNLDLGKGQYYVKKTLAACLMCVLFLGIGGVTVLANMEMNIDPGNYGQWVDVLSDGNWETCNKILKKQGITLPERFGKYKYTDYSKLLVAKKGDTYLDALIQNVYKPINIEYDTITISLGSLDEEYWSVYYEFENDNDIWVYKDAESSFEYEGLMIYGRDNINWRWIDEQNKVCWCVYVPPVAKIDSQEIIKTIIDLNNRIQ